MLHVITNEHNNSLVSKTEEREKKNAFFGIPNIQSSSFWNSMGIVVLYIVSLTREKFLDFCSDSLCPLNVEVERVWCVAVTPTEPNEEETVTTAKYAT